MNIAICGLTAAGKTTHSRLLARDLGYTYVSAAEILLELSEIDLASSKEMWFTHFDQIEEAREGDHIDDGLEARLKTLATAKSDMVFDTWALPWLCDAPMISVWIESDPRSRSWKCFMSQSEPRAFSIAECAELIEKKDSTTATRFARRHGFDLYHDHDRFDMVLDNTTLIRAPSDEAVRNGIAAFKGYCDAAIASMMAGDDAPLYRFVTDHKREARSVILRTPFSRVEQVLAADDAR